MNDNNKLLTLSDSEKGWLMIGVCLGIILTIIFLYVYTYLPTINPMQQAGLIGFVCGGAIVFFINRFEFG